MENSEALRTLSDLIEEARLLAAPSAGFKDSFYSWHARTREALDEIFGPNSEEKTEFLKIRYVVKPPPTSVLHPAGELKVDWTDAKLGFYQNRLYDAAEFLLGLKILVKSDFRPE